MPKQSHRRPSRKRAIQAALGQLGWQASSKEVVALLASRQIAVSEGLVSKVKVENLKQAEQAKLREAKTKRVDNRQRRPLIQKKPQQRTYRR
jgi:hypothetical protein